jgi:hypothetical protein
MTLLRLTVYAAIALAGPAAHAAADHVPRYDVGPGCHSVARGAEDPRKDAQACIDEELRLRDELVREWSTFHAEDKARCTRRLGGAWRPTFTELATCLEIARAARELPEQLTSSTVRQGR